MFRATIQLSRCLDQGLTQFSGRRMSIRIVNSEMICYFNGTHHRQIDVCAQSIKQ